MRFEATVIRKENISGSGLLKKYKDVNVDAYINSNSKFRFPNNIVYLDFKSINCIISLSNPYRVYRELLDYPHENYLCLDIGKQNIYKHKKYIISCLKQMGIFCDIISKFDYIRNDEF